MWPWGHLGIGYLLYAAYTTVRDHTRPRGLAVVALALGTQLPDAIDKPLAYWTSILPEGRSLAHSLLVTGPLCAVLLDRTRSNPANRTATTALILGYASHLLADSYGAILKRQPEQLTYLLWPALPMPDYPAAGFGHHGEKLIASLENLSPGRLVGKPTDAFVAQVWLFGAGVVLWIAHGLPPLPELGKRRAPSERLDGEE